MPAITRNKKPTISDKSKNRVKDNECMFFLMFVALKKVQDQMP